MLVPRHPDDIATMPRRRYPELIVRSVRAVDEYPVDGHVVLSELAQVLATSRRRLLTICRREAIPYYLCPSLITGKSRLRRVLVVTTSSARRLAEIHRGMPVQAVALAERRP